MCEYKIQNDYIVGYTKNKNQPFYFDIENYENIKNFKWISSTTGDTNNYYIRSQIDGKNVYMHRYIMNAPIGYQIDHINRMKFDNRKLNLRIVQQSENAINKGLRRDNKTGIKGVHMNKYGKYVAQIRAYNKVKHLGTFTTLKEATSVRKEYEKILHGDFSYDRY